jgi:predicted nucleic acid-binding Zn ribbon protein
MPQEKKKTTPEEVGTILERLFTRLKLGGKMKQYQIWDVWDSVVGPHLALQAQPHKIRNMVLWVNVSSSTWMQELEFMKHLIIERLNEHIGEKVINDLRFRIGEISPTNDEVSKKDTPLER